MMNGYVVMIKEKDGRYVYDSAVLTIVTRKSAFRRYNEIQKNTPQENPRIYKLKGVLIKK